MPVNYAVYYIDSSGLVKRYMREVGTAWVISLTNPTSGNRIYIASITSVEVIAAIARQGRGGKLSATDASTAIQQFRHDFVTQYRVVDPVSVVIQRAMAIAEKHALRGYDAVQLAAALDIHTRRLALKLPALTFISADIALNAAATAEGLIVDDPNAHP